MPDDREPMDELVAAIAEAKATWPGVALDEAAFADAVRARAAAEGGNVGALHVTDLYLATACAAGDAAALGHLERVCMPAVRATLGRMHYGPTQIDDTLQALREDLLFATDGQPPEIAQFAGRGPLRGWLRVVAGRIAGRLHRRAAHERAPAEDAAELADVAHDPEIELLRRTYGPAVSEATRAALRALPLRDRLLLKQRFRHGMELEEIAAMHGVHGSTISRWVTRARGLLVQGTREVVMARLGLSASEVISVMRLVESRLDVTLSSIDERTG